MSKKLRNNIILFLIVLALTLGLVYACSPFIWMISSSFKSNNEIFTQPPQLIPRIFTYSTYLNILQSPGKLQFFINSYIVSFSATALTLIIAILAGYAFSRYEFRLKKVLNVFIISTQGVPTMTLLIPYFGLVVSMRLYDTYTALILTYLVFTLPYAITMMTGYFNTLPKELDEAVQIDGGSVSRCLWRILVPIALPGIIATGVYTFLLCWNEYLFALCLTKSTEMRTVPVGIQLLMGEHTYEWNEMMAMSVLGSLPIVIVYMFAQKYFLAGLTSGAVKS